LTFEDGTDIWSLNIGKELYYWLRNTQQEGRFQLHIMSFGNVFRPVTAKYRLSLTNTQKYNQYLILSTHQVSVFEAGNFFYAVGQVSDTV
jgi:hypothetical protein